MADKGRRTELIGGGGLTRFSSRLDRLSHVYLKDRLVGATEYCRIAGYFRSSIFDLVNEEIDSIPKVRIVCNSDLDVRDIQASKLAREQMLKERWNEVDDELETFIRRPRYQRLYDLLKKGNVEVRVVSRADAPFLHGKAGVIRRPEGASAFMGSLNETREGWAENYELVWEDTSQDGVEWVSEEFEHLWAKGKPLPDAIIEEIGRSARKQQVALADLRPEEIGPAALVEAPIYRRGEDLKPWQRAFVEMFLQHREIYGKCRLLLADEVGVGKTLSLAGAALVSSLLGDGPALILCPATLCLQWQTELSDKLGIPSAVWLSSKKVWLDHKGHEIKTRGPQDVTRCPFQIAIVSTGLIVHGAEESEVLKSARLGTLILDEGHKARRSAILGGDRDKPNNLLTFMLHTAKNARHVLIGTATPIQTDVRELWDILEILNRSADHVLGRSNSLWRDADKAIPIITGQIGIEDENEAWELLRNPLPPRQEEDPLFDSVRTDLNIRNDIFFCDKPLIDVDAFTRQSLNIALTDTSDGLSFFRKNNPIVRHVVLRRRSTLEDKGLLPCIAVDIWPMAGNAGPMFDGFGLQTSSEFDMAYEAVEKFTDALAKRKKSAGFMRNLLRQRICSSYASGLSTAEKLLESRSLNGDEADQYDLTLDFADIIDEEVTYLEQIRHHLSSKPTDPKLEAVRHFLIDRGWLGLGCIAFSQYYDTAYWVAENLAVQLADETVAVYAGAGKSGVFLKGDWRSADREKIKKAVREREIRLVIATDAACEGLNLQTLGTLINIDLPWNPSRLEQRIGRIKRFGQLRDRVDMLNLVYAGTVDEKVYRTLSSRMKDRYDIFGSLPDVIEDEWIEDIEHLDEYLRQFTERKKRANAFDIRYGETVDPEGPGWELCEKVLARSDVIERLSRGW